MVRWLSLYNECVALTEPTDNWLGWLSESVTLVVMMCIEEGYLYNISTIYCWFWNGWGDHLDHLEIDSR